MQTGNFAVEAWVNLRSVGTSNSYSFIAGKDGCGNANIYALGATPGGGAQLRLINSSGTDFTAFAGTPLTTNVWHHLVGVRDGTTLKIFVDGVQAGSTAISGTFGSQTFPFTIGERPFAPEVVNTTIGDATITFPTVTTAGTTQQIPLVTGLFPALPMGTHTGLAYDLATTAIFTANPSVCFNLPSFTTTQFTNLRVMHFENGNWVNVTATNNTFPTLCTDPITSFSPFAIANIAPTAAAVSVGGRVKTSAGYGIPRVRVSLTNMAGENRTVFTNLFGYYRFTEVPSGETYSVSVDAKRYRFKAPTSVVLVVDDIADLDFVALP